MSSKIWYLQWTARNNWELIAAMAFVTGLLAICFWIIGRLGNFPRAALVLTLAVCLIPLFSFAGYLFQGKELKAFFFSIPGLPFLLRFLRMAELRDFLIKAGGWSCAHGRVAAAVAVPLFAGLAYIVLRRAKMFLRGLDYLLCSAGAPLGVLAILTILVFGRQTMPSRISNAVPAGLSQAREGVVVLLFDELAYDWIYKNSSLLPGLSNLRNFSAISDNFHEAKSYGDSTLTSVPSLLEGTFLGRMEVSGSHLVRVRPDGKGEVVHRADSNLFTLAHDRGYRAACVDWYVDCCDFFGKALDGCRAFSHYNAGSVEDSFSLFNPIRTTVMLWPEHSPLSLINKRMYNDFYRRTTEEINAQVADFISSEGPLFLFAHFNIPHGVFIYDRSGYNPPVDSWLDTPQSYMDQVEYVDVVFGKLLEELKRTGRFERSTVVVMSDHGYRALAESRKALTHVALIIHHPGQTRRRDVFTPLLSGKIVKELLRPVH
jgi:hypothetical protein